MQESEFSFRSSIGTLTPQEKVAKFSREMSTLFVLTPEASDHLRSYGNVISRIMQIRRDFQFDWVEKVVYKGWSVEDESETKIITRDNFRDDIKTYEKIEKVIYADFLSDNANTSEAAGYIKTFVSDLFPGL